MSKYENINQIDSEGNTAIMRICKGDCLLRDFDDDTPVTTLKTLIDLGSTLDVINYTGDTALTLLASYSSFYPHVNERSVVMGRLLLQNGVPQQVVNNQGKTALLLASVSGLDQLVCELINNGDNINHITPKDGRSILQHVCQVNNGKIALTLLDHGADKDHRDYQGRTALAIAIDNGHEALAYILIVQYNCNVNVADIGGLTPLHLAIIRNLERVVDVLLGSDANRLLRCNNGKTPLMVAVSERKMKLVDSLLSVNTTEEERRQVVNQIDNDGVTPLIEAVKRKDLGITKMLLKTGDVFISHCDYKQGWNALMWAIDAHYLEEIDLAEQAIVHCLVGAYCTSPVINETSQCAAGQTALHFAIGKPIWILDALLLNAGEFAINLDIPDNDGCTPLMRALIKGHYASHHARLLIEHGANLNVETNWLGYGGYGYMTPLKWVAGSSQTFLTKYYLDRGALVDYQTRDGETALMYAIRNGVNEENIRILLDKNPNVNLVNSDGETAYSIATEVLDPVFDHRVWDAIKV